MSNFASHKPGDSVEFMEGLVRKTGVIQEIDAAGMAYVKDASGVRYLHDLCVLKNLSRPKEINHEDTHTIVCPYCGWHDREAHKLENDCGVMECGECDKEFDFERHVRTTYTTSYRIQ